LQVSNKYSIYASPSHDTKKGQKHRLFLKFAYQIWKRWLKRLISNYEKQEEDIVIIECGSGPGILLRFITEWYPEISVFGLDYDYQLIRSSRSEAPKAYFITANAESIPVSSNSINILITLHMVEHLIIPEKFLKEAARVLVPEGTMILATPNPIGIAAKVLGNSWVSCRKDHISLHPPIWWQEHILSSGFHILKNGTTGLSGLRLFKRLPLSLFNWGLLYIFGFFPWRYGESYACIACKKKELAN